MEAEKAQRIEAERAEAEKMKALAAAEAEEWNRLDDDPDVVVGEFEEQVGQCQEFLRAMRSFDADCE